MVGSNQAIQAMSIQLIRPSVKQTFVVILGLLLGTQIMRLFPAPPVFSERLGRITQFQSYENGYFATLRSFTEHVDRLAAKGLTPVIVLGDSAFRGTGAAGDNVWTRRLQTYLSSYDPLLRVVNFAQNAGDLSAPYLFYHFYERFPQAIFVMQWHHTNRSMLRHPFHFWLTSEIILRDGRKNPAVEIGLDKTPINTSSPTEGMSLVMAGMNIIAPYLDLGNYLRYWWFGNLSISPSRNPVVIPLADAAEADHDIFSFTPRPDPALNATMSQTYRAVTEELGRFVDRPPNEIRDFFDDEFRPAFRDRLLLVSIDLNPYFAPRGDPGALETWARHWRTLTERMAEVRGLDWTALVASRGELSENDFIDLGHLSVPGQAKLAQRVAVALLRMPIVQQTHRRHAEP
jgi:hypothetical protein